MLTLRAISRPLPGLNLETDRYALDETDPTSSGASPKKCKQLDALKCGIDIVKVNLKKADPPDKVRDAFTAVNRAEHPRPHCNDAEGSEKIPLHEAQDRAIKEAEGYKIGRINRATGDAKAFLAVLEEYRKAEDVTRHDCTEAMEKALPGSAR